MDKYSKINGSLISHFSNLVKQFGGINLAQGIPGFQPPIELLNQLSKLASSNCHQYAPGLGNSKLREQILRNYPNLSSSTDLFITNGATEAISLIYTYLESFLKKDLKVLTFSPAYESYIHLPNIFGNSLTTIPVSDEYYFEKEKLIDHIHTNKIKLIFLASPGNPFGKIATKQEIQELVSICNKENVYLIIDAVYSELYFGKEKPYYPTENISEYIFYVNSYSKKLSITGWRIGYFLANNKHFKQISYIHDYIGLSSPAPLQEAVANYLAEEDSSIYVAKLLSIMQENLEKSTQKLVNNGFDCPRIDGGYFIWAKLPNTWTNSLEFGVDLYDKYKTAIIPGRHFGAEWDNYIRINIAREKQELEQGIENIIEFTKKSK